MEMSRNTNSTTFLLNLSDSNITYSDDHDQSEDTYESAIYFYCIILPVAFIGLVGNGLNFVLLSTAAYKRQSFAVYLRALAVTDSVELIVSAIEDIDGKFLGEILDTIRSLCPISLFFNSVSGNVSSFLVIALAVDRYVAVVYPLRRAILCTYRRAVIVTAIVITVSAAMSLVSVVWNEIATVASFEDGANNFTETEYICPMINIEEFEMVASVWSLVYLLLGPLCVVSALNIRVFVAIRYHAKLREFSSSSHAGGVAIKTTLTLIMATFSSVIFSVPLLCVEFLEFFTDFNGGENGAWELTKAVQSLNYALNFYVFILNGKAYRRALRQAFQINRPSLKSSTSDGRSDNFGKVNVSKTHTMESGLSSD